MLLGTCLLWVYDNHQIFLFLLNWIGVALYVQENVVQHISSQLKKLWIAGKHYLHHSAIHFITMKDKVNRMYV